MKTETPSRTARPARRKNRSSAFTLIELLVVIAIISILAGIAVPVLIRAQVRAAMMSDLSNARQIVLGLRMYAADNNGTFPTTDPTVGSGTATSSNGAFRNLVPQYIPQEKIFYVAKSAWTPKPPDENYIGANCLVAGENNYAYVSGLNDSSNPNDPLVVDGFSSSSPNADTYSTNQQSKGGVWQGAFAIVANTDGSTSIQKVDPATLHVLGITAPDPGSANDIFAPTANWLTGCTILNPL